MQCKGVFYAVLTNHNDHLPYQLCVLVNNCDHIYGHFINTGQVLLIHLRTIKALKQKTKIVKIILNNHCRLKRIAELTEERYHWDHFQRAFIPADERLNIDRQSKTIQI